MNHFQWTAEQVKTAVEAKGYKYFTGHKGYDLNIIGIRTSNNDADTFNDWLTVSYTLDGNINMFAFPCTTDPGLYYKEKPVNVKGTAKLVEGQHSALWSIGRHKGKYTALTQHSRVVVARGSSRDVGVFGINLHRANEKRASTVIGKWSAGCQVIQDPLHFDFIMALCKKQVSHLGYKTFTYTLLSDTDLV